MASGWRSRRTQRLGGQRSRCRRLAQPRPRERRQGRRRRRGAGGQGGDGGGPPPPQRRSAKAARRRAARALAARRVQAAEGPTRYVRPPSRCRRPNLARKFEAVETRHGPLFAARVEWRACLRLPLRSRPQKAGVRLPRINVLEARALRRIVEMHLGEGASTRGPIALATRALSQGPSVMGGPRPASSNWSAGDW